MISHMYIRITNIDFTVEITAVNNIPREQAVAKFFKDTGQQYDDKLGFESKININILLNMLTY